MGFGFMAEVDGCFDHDEWLCLVFCLKDGGV